MISWPLMSLIITTAVSCLQKYFCVNYKHTIPIYKQKRIKRSSGTRMVAPQCPKLGHMTACVLASRWQTTIVIVLADLETFQVCRNMQLVWRINFQAESGPRDLFERPIKAFVVCGMLAQMGKK